MPDQLDEDLRRGIWLGGVQPRLPAFASGPPPVVPVATSLHDHDTLIVSLEGAAPRAVPLSRFAALVRDGHSDGAVHVGHHGAVQLVPFAQFHAYFWPPSPRQPRVGQEPR